MNGLILKINAKKNSNEMFMEKLSSKSLMLGDWVLCDGEPYQVAEISAGLLCIDAERELFATPEDLQPIPLTPEILEKNGFDISDGDVMQYDFIEDGQKYHFTLRQMYNKQGERDGFSFFAFNVLTLILSIHELQHALRLCGIEKEIII